MVKINSIEGDINSLEEDLYIRILNEFRIEFENQILYYLINYLLTKNKINSEYLKSEINYLNKLCERYHIKKIKLKINSEKENEIIDESLKLMKRAKKAIDYSYLDVADFYYKKSKYFAKLRLNKNFAIIFKNILIEYNHKIPEKISKAPEEKIILKNHNFSGKEFKNFESKIYLEFSKSLKISIDKMFLKVYDYLIETNLKEINSPKMYFLKKDFEDIGKKYNKLKYDVKIKNKNSKNINDSFLDEIAANLFRVKEIFIN
jgi:hypothetical protein